MLNSLRSAISIACTIFCISWSSHAYAREINDNAAVSDNVAFTKSTDGVITDSVQNLRVPNGYYTVDALNLIADSLAQNFPNICALYQIGTSSAAHPMFALKISDNVTADEIEPEVMFDGGIHGDEIGGPENLIRFARDLCVQYGTDQTITQAVDSAEIWIIYCLNPYGRENMTRYNASGVDINRDCGYMWNASGSSNGVFSEPETKILRNMLTSHQMVLHISYHSGTEYISFPWSYRPDLTPDHDNHNFLAQQYALNSGYDNIPYGPGYSGMYAINGSTKDFGYGATGAISWSVEISLSKQPPAAQIIPYYHKNKPAMLSMIEHAYTQGVKGIVTDSLTGQPVPATIFVDAFYPVNNNALQGDFHKFLTPGTYTVRVEANGYVSKAISGIEILPGEVTALSVPLSRGGGYFATSLISCMIPNNNHNDEGFTPALLSKPDSVAYSIGRNGFLIADLGISVLDRPGNDLTIFENDNTPEGYRVYAGLTPDGPWIMLGMGIATASFDLGSTLLSTARYIKVTDDGDGSSQVADAGFELDAIENLHPDTLTVGWIAGTIMNDQIPYFTIPGAEITINNEVTMYADENGFYQLPSFPGSVVISAKAPYYIGTDTVIVVLGDTLTHDMHLHLTESAGNLTSRLNGFRLYPNPVHDYLQLEVTDTTANADYDYAIYDIRGTLLQRGQLPAGSSVYRIQTQTLTSGTYIIHIYNTEVSETIKFSAQKE